MENMSYLAKQIELDRERKQAQLIIDKKYYKPHFGPEETDEQLDLVDAAIAYKKSFVKQHLTDQMALKKNIHQENFDNERLCDLNNILAAQTLFNAEEKAK